MRLSAMLIGGLLAAGSAGAAPAMAQPASQQRDWVHLPNGTRYTYCTGHGCFDGVILDQPNGEVCEGVGLRDFQRQRYFCHK